jgi:hypothetical protein
MINRTVYEDLPIALDMYEDPTFKQLELPEWLNNLRKVAMAHELGARAVGVRALQLLTMLRGTGLWDYVRCLDDRSTFKTNTIIEPAYANASPPVSDLLPTLDRRIGPEDEERLFGSEPREQPYATFFDLWRNNDHVAYQLGGAILAIAWRIEECRNRQHQSQKLNESSTD